MSLHEAVDELQARAELDGLVVLVGQDAVQAMMSAAFAAVRSSIAEVTEPIIDETEKPITRAHMPGSTVNAFRYLVGLNNPDRLKAWLRQRPDEAPSLFELLHEGG
jgi:hypothetical protein